MATHLRGQPRAINSVAESRVLFAPQMIMLSRQENYQVDGRLISIPALYGIIMTHILIFKIRISGFMSSFFWP